MNNHAQLIEWGINLLASDGCQIKQAPEMVVQTPWSIVIRLSTSKGYFYLKQTPVDLFVEFDVIKAIQKNIPNSPTPTLLFKNSDLNCYLMKSCGDHSLRTKFNGTIDSDLLNKGLNGYITILRSFEKNPDCLKLINIPDWRVNHLPQLFIELLKKEDLLQDEGLSQDDLDKLLKLVPTIQSICEVLAERNIKETLVNVDFNENNMIINETTKQISYIDWGESVISHPFFSIASHLQSISRRYKLALTGEILVNLKHQCLSCWLDAANMNDLTSIYQDILRIHPIYSALGLYRLQAATNNKSKEKQNWFIGDTLKKLITNEAIKI